MLADLSAAHAVERERGQHCSTRSDKPILMTASTGGPMGWLTADTRPSSSRRSSPIEPLGPPFRTDSDFSLDWGLTAAPMTFDPPAASPDELLKTPAGTWTLQAEPAAKLPKLAGIPIAIVEAGRPCSPPPVRPRRIPGASQVSVDRIVLAEHSVHGNGHLMMLSETAATPRSRSCTGWTTRSRDTTH